MANALTTAMGVLADALKGTAGTTVTYRRGGLTASLTATKCPIRPESDVTNQESEPCDWIIKASLIVLGGETVEPNAITDEIVESDGQEWRVLDLPNEPAFRPLDPYRTMFRIHTKRTKEAD